jgi:D-alanyl-D-alanine carboxypeptidase
LLGTAVVATACSSSGGPPGGGMGTTSTGPPTSSATVEAVPADAAAAARRAEVGAALERLWDRTPPSSCLLVSDGEGVVFEQRADEPVVPASAIKLVTTTAALAHLGPAAPVSGEAEDGLTASDLVRRMVLDSDNPAAEQLLRELGAHRTEEASVAAGLRLVAPTIEALGLPADGLRVEDATGHDRDNAVTCRLLVALLTDGPAADHLVDSLPVAAETGTLTDRFVGTRVAGRLRAKTGSIRGVAALVGQADAGGGHRVTFAYVLNGLGDDDGRGLLDDLGLALVPEEGS